MPQNITTAIFPVGGLGTRFLCADIGKALKIWMQEQ